MVNGAGTGSRLGGKQPKEHPKASTSGSRKRERSQQMIRDSPEPSVRPKPLACPFVKRYPDKAWPPGCLDKFWNISKVREHLNRRHKTPIYCERCSRIFTHEFHLKRHDEHDMCREIGEPFDTSEYMTDETWAKLRAHRCARNLSEPLKWEVFYDILFPDQPPPWPYASSPSSGNNEESKGELRTGTVQMVGSGADSLGLPEGSGDIAQMMMPTFGSVSGGLHPTPFDSEESYRDKSNQCGLRASQEAAWEDAIEIDSGDPLNFEDFINFEPEEEDREEMNQRDPEASQHAAGMDDYEFMSGGFLSFEDFSYFEDYFAALEAGVDEVNPLLSTPPNLSTGEQNAAQLSNRIQQGAELTQTEYSDDLSISTESLDGRISDFVTELFDGIGKEALDVDVFQSVVALLPDLLKQYALKVGDESESQAHRDMMCLVHKYRSRITQQFSSLYQSAQGKLLHINLDTVSSEERSQRVCKWLQKLEDLEDLTDVPTDFPIFGLEREETEINSSYCASASTRMDSEMFVEPQSRIHHDSIVDGEAFSWLTSRLRRELQADPTQMESIVAIRRTVSKQLETTCKISRKVSPQPLMATFVVEWDPIQFLREQRPSLSTAVEDISRIITVTGIAQNGQVLTSGQYLSQTWPTTGPSLIKHLEALLAKDVGITQSDVFNDKARVTTRLYEENLVAEVQGTSASVLDIGEQLAWLGAALRASPDPSKIAYCVPSVQVCEPTSGGTNYRIRFTTEVLNRPLVASNGQCWHGLFKNPTIVKGFPITSRPVLGTGIEIPLNIMATLVGTTRVDCFNDRIFIKGFSAMLVPTRREKDVVYWHVYCTHDDDRISYTHYVPRHAGQKSSFQMESSRHILGWSIEAEFYAGSSHASYDIQNSFLEDPIPNSLLTDAYVTQGSILGKGPSFVVCKKDTTLIDLSSRDGLRKRLEWIARQMVLLWDTVDKQGWLINGLSALLHLVRASLEHNRLGRFNAGFSFRAEDLRGAHRLTPDAAVDILCDRTNRALKIYDDEDEVLGDRADTFYNILEKLVDYQKLVAGQEGTKIQQPRRYLEGWDFHDLVVKNDDRIFPRMTTLEPPGIAWVDLTRSLSTVTLFGRGFGQLIKPSPTTTICHKWRELPKGKYYIAASLSDLRPLLNCPSPTSSNDGHTRLGRKLLWHTETELFEIRSCADDDNHLCIEPVQSILPSNACQDILPRKPSIIPASQRGAVIFGQHSKSLFDWDDFMTPDMSKNGASRTESRSVLSPRDSGIGSTAKSDVTRSTTEQSLPVEVPRHSSDGFDLLFTPQRTGRSNSYTIGVICALDKELKVVRASMDQEFSGPRTTSVDSNNYVFGRIGHHLVVGACLPAENYGNNPASVCVENMRRSFEMIRFCFLVGIGGGVPSESSDIRLGDVVVGLGDRGLPAVIQYDRGKEHDNQVFKRTGSLPNPPTYLLTAISKLRSDPQLPSDPLRQYVKEMITRMPDAEAARYQCPGPQLDSLFEAGDLNPPREVVRAPRPADHPVIHYGPIASGNKVVKSAEFRDKLSREDGVLCFEMEAAGIVNSVPTLVVRGICDYSDMHKSKEWQDYAAANAAAYMKLLLSVMPAQPWISASYYGRKGGSDDEEVLGGHPHKRLKTVD